MEFGLLAFSLCDVFLKEHHDHKHHKPRIKISLTCLFIERIYYIVRVGLAYLLAHRPRGHMWVITPRFMGRISPQKTRSPEIP